MSGKAYELFSKYIEKGNIGKFAGELKEKLDNDFLDTMAILRDENFQNLLINYPRNDKSFIRAVSYIDEVTIKKKAPYAWNIIIYPVQTELCK